VAGLCPDPLGQLTALPRPMGGFRGPTSKGQEGEEKRVGQARGREGTIWDGRRGWRRVSSTTS